MELIDEDRLVDVVGGMQEETPQQVQQDLDKWLQFKTDQDGQA